MRWLPLLLLLVVCGGEQDPLAPYTACPGGSAACGPPCRAFGDASVCGPTCDGLGVCGDESLAGSCLWDNQNPAKDGLCVLTCSVDEDCPVEGMRCRLCDLGEVCAVNAGIGLGSDVCAWPD